MADVRPLRAIRYDPSRVDLDRVLAPPYDVIGAEAHRELLARDPHNVVRVDLTTADPRGGDPYAAAAGHLQRWQEEGVMVREDRPSMYVLEHDFPLEDGSRRTRRGLFARIAARPWSEAPIKPHERTLPGPKQDRLCLMRASGAQTSPVFGLWREAPAMAAVLSATTARPPLMTCSLAGEVGREGLKMWAVSEPDSVETLSGALRDAQLYIADGHHRYETAARYRLERREQDPGAAADADFEHSLVHLCDADDPSLVVLPTHRLIPAGEGVPQTVEEIERSLAGRFAVSGCDVLEEAVSQAAALRQGHHAVVLVAIDGLALLSRPRSGGADPRAGLDATVLEEMLGAWGVTPEAVRGGALSYERDATAVAAAVAAGQFALGAILNGCTTQEMMAVADAGGTMPQKSTYFYPKVPTGLVISPL